MPKRKAVGPADGSDGEGEEYYSFPSTPAQSPFPKSVPNNFHGAVTPKKIPALPSSGAANFFLSNSGGLQGQTLPSFMGQQNKPSMFSTSSHSGTSLVTSTSSSTALAPVAAKKPRSSEFAKVVKDLNNAFVTACRASVSKNPSHSLVPLVKDYLHHSRVLMEQCKEEADGKSSELVNGIPFSSVPRSFQSLGEFFESFEQNFIESKKVEERFATSSALTNSSSLSMYLSSGTGEKLNNNINFNMTTTRPSSTPSTTFNINATASPMTQSSIASNVSTSTSPSASNSDMSKSKTSFTSSLGQSPLKTLTSSTTVSPISSIKPSESTTVAKPAAPAPFAGFSFFTPPAPNPGGGFGFNASASGANSQSDKKNNDDEEEDEEPPKVEITQVTEDDAVYSIRCKVFGMVDGKYKDKGVGMLYVKKLEGGKHQVVVRADNNLGTVILNILLQKTLPLEKKSAKDVMTVDLTANDKKGMPILLRVKSEGEATDLFSKLKEFKDADSS